MEDLLLIITDKLNEVSELNYKDENWGQLMDYGKDCPVKWPCALVHMAGGQFTNLANNYRSDSGNLQEGLISIEITVANLKLTNTSARAPINQRTKGFFIENVVQKVHEVLHGWRPLENSGAMIRTSSQSVMRDDGVQEKKITYTIGLHAC